MALRERVACMAEELTAARQAAPSRLQDSPAQEPEALETPAEAEDAEIQVCLLSSETGARQRGQQHALLCGRLDQPQAGIKYMLD